MTEPEIAKVLALTRSLLSMASRVALAYRIPFPTFRKMAEESMFEIMRRESGMLPLADVYTMANHDPMLVRHAIKEIRDDGTFSITPHMESYVSGQVCGKILQTWKSKFVDRSTGKPMKLQRARQGLPTLRRVIEAAHVNANVGPVKRELIRFGCAVETDEGELEYIHDQIGSRPNVDLDLEATEQRLREEFEKVMAPLLDALEQDYASAPEPEVLG